MLYNLIKKEFLEHVLGFRFLVSCILCLGMVTTSVFILRGDYINRLRMYEVNMDSSEEQIRSENSLSRLSKHGVRVDARPGPMQIPVFGLEKDHRIALVTGKHFPEFEQDRSLNPIGEIFPVADMLFVVATILSLLAFVVSYDAVSGERENGTLRLLMSYAVPRDVVILGKWFGGYLSLITPFVMAAVIAALILLISPEVGFSMDDWVSYLLVVVVSLLLLAAVFSVGLFVSTLCREGSTSIAVLIFLWVTGILIVPNNSPFIASVFVQTASPTEIENEVRSDRIAFTNQQHRTVYAPAQEDFTKRLHNAKSAEEKKEISEERDQFKRELIADIAKEEMEREGRIRKPHDKVLMSQIGLSQGLSRFSPVANFVYAATDIATTGMQCHFDYRDALENYSQDFRTYINDNWKKGSGGGLGKKKEEKKEFDAAGMPKFNYTPPSIEERLSNSLLDIGSLAGCTILFFLAAFITFIRKDLLG
ncbi:ABC transporter permease [Candidatus Hydrogenedentota bacterium]